MIPILVPIVEKLDFCRMNVYEHLPLDYYRYGEYPRYLMPVGANPPRTKVVWVDQTKIEIRAASTD